MPCGRGGRCALVTEYSNTQDGTPLGRWKEFLDSFEKIGHGGLAMTMTTPQ